MFEHRHEPLLPRIEFVLRLLRASGIAAGIILGSLAIGTIGYHSLGGLPWVDALLNASMILSGMGPVDALHSAVAKLFASAYALFSGVVFLSTTAVLMAPLLHRLIHRFHLEFEEEEGGPS